MLSPRTHVLHMTRTHAYSHHICVLHLQYEKGFGQNPEGKRALERISSHQPFITMGLGTFKEENFDKKETYHTQLSMWDASIIGPQNVRLCSARIVYTVVSRRAQSYLRTSPTYFTFAYLRTHVYTFNTLYDHPDKPR